ncbi:MAG: NAD(P)/FAD-dependent oxidoreductase [Deltaproteobacteria bacterium]|nr:NAD(P)/FAD-dependent oxidoreductase [Deltaproteobacteria bacterium]
MTQTSKISAPIVVVGGGLAGLTAAVILGRAGRRVVLYEKAKALGGRAQTQGRAGYRFNIGPHALYRGGAARRIFAEMGLSFAGAAPRPAGGFAVSGGRKHALPGGFVSLLTTSLLRLPGKIELARLMGTLPKLRPSAAEGLTLRQWTEQQLRQPNVRALVQALARLSTYTNAPDRLSASVALEQLQLALSQNVDYLDGGWQVMVDALRHAADAAGVRVESGRRVVAVEHDDALRGVRLADGETAAAEAVILAMAPDEAAELMPGSASLRAWAQAALPIQAACLDLALSSLPQPRATFALGIDAPLYLSVHSAVAKLAPQGGALIHVAKYLDPTTASAAKDDEAELERLMDLVQSGWRQVVVDRRFLPSMTVSHALVEAKRGFAGRPGPAVPGIAGVLVAGDWVGSQGLLLDASIASAKQAAERLLAAAPAQAAAA